MLELFFQLAIVHFVADYPLQGDFMAKAKNHRLSIPGVPFYHPLVAHAAIQAGGVWLVMGSPALAVAEFLAHAVIDYAKSDGRFGFGVDQCLHLACKAAWVLAMVLFL